MFIPKSLLFSLTREADMALLVAGLMCETVKTFVSSTLILTETHKLLQPLTTPTWCKVWKLVNGKLVKLSLFTVKQKPIHTSTVYNPIVFLEDQILNSNSKYWFNMSFYYLLHLVEFVRECCPVNGMTPHVQSIQAVGSALSRFWTKTSAKLWHFWLCCAPRLISSSLEAYLGFQELWLRQRRLWSVYGNTHPLRRLYGGIQHHLVTFRHK